MRFFLTMAALTALCSAAPAQEAPMKMGLWETTSVITMQLPPGMPSMMGGTRTITVQSCLTPESWQKTMERAQNPRKDCTYTDKTVTATGMTFAMTCTGRSTTMVKGETVFESKEKGSSTVHMEMSTSGSGGGKMVTDSKGTTRYLGADCGKVKPYTDK
ncbi:DUF3617 domain-containing protein [Granulicella tundricola]|uniref:DUF3617 domain-containing protein n=1 Tax=Granulicella tundricola (strain ATCC BAA-1859 / DSM 23138 / MP5ACTX9) TaxID=1198114 RepID=E8WZI0_GRATM|nr:DUF3617 domain-containing protein [Granulicella tundricola]ADW68868.1 hypothetical protein AciX9_1821 [Granulicella tundricola MP5ACTX9]